MSGFTVGLAILGGLVLAAIVAWNAWAARRNTPRQPELAVAAAAAGEAALKERSEPVFDIDVDGAPLAPMPLPLPERKPGLDGLIDALAQVAVDNLVSGEAALAALPPTRRAGSKPFAIEGRNEHSGEWETPRAGQRYVAFQAGVQLANRSGALNEIEFSEFVMKVQAFADAINGSAEFPEMRDEVGRARELDQFAGSHDAQLGFTLRARNAAWSPGYVQQNAARLGFVAGAIPGRLVLPATQPGIPPVLGLAFSTQAALSEDPSHSAIRELTLSLDVTHVPRNEQPFVRMRDAAVALAAAMDGLITDDDGRVIPVEALDAIGADLEHLYDTLVAAGRLFS